LGANAKLFKALRVDPETVGIGLVALKGAAGGWPWNRCAPCALALVGVVCTRDGLLVDRPNDPERLGVAGKSEVVPEVVPEDRASMGAKGLGLMGESSVIISPKSTSRFSKSFIRGLSGKAWDGAESSISGPKKRSSTKILKRIANKNRRRSQNNVPHH